MTENAEVLDTSSKKTTSNMNMSFLVREKLLYNLDVLLSFSPLNSSMKKNFFGNF
jgi:hypothetical protein